MNKRIMVVICIVVTTVSFFGGVLYTSPTFEARLEQKETEYDEMTARFRTLIFRVYDLPPEIPWWFDWAILQHQNAIKDGDTELMSLELHQKCIDLYSSVKDTVLEFERQWGLAEIRESRDRERARRAE